MRLSRKPAARRRRSCLLVIILLLGGGAIACTLLRRDPVAAYTAGLGLLPESAGERIAATLPVDLNQLPFAEQLAASKAAGLDFSHLAGRAISHVRLNVGHLTGTDEIVWLNIYLAGRRIVGAFLTSGEGAAAWPVNSPSIIFEPNR